MITFIIILSLLICIPILVLVAGTLALPIIGVFLALTIVFSIIAVIFKLVFSGPLVTLALIFAVFYFLKKRKMFY